MLYEYFKNEINKVRFYRWPIFGEGVLELGVKIPPRAQLIENEKIFKSCEKNQMQNISFENICLWLNS